MKTKASQIIEVMKANNAKFICKSSVWDIYHAGIGVSKNSAVYKDVKRIFESDKDILRITAIVGAKGRSGHSKTQILLFDTSNMTSEQEWNAGYFYNCNEFFHHNYTNEKPRFIQK